MTEEQIKALLNLIKENEKIALTGNLQINYFRGTVGTIQILTSYKMDAFEAIYGNNNQKGDIIKK